MDPRPRDGAYVYGTQGPYFLGVTHYSYGEGSCTTFIPFLVCYTLADAMVGVSITEFQPLLIPPTWITPRSHRVWLPVTMSTLPSHYPPFSSPLIDGFVWLAMEEAGFCNLTSLIRFRRRIRSFVYLYLLMEEYRCPASGVHTLLPDKNSSPYQSSPLSGPCTRKRKPLRDLPYLHTSGKPSFLYIYLPGVTLPEQPGTLAQNRRKITSPSLTHEWVSRSNSSHWLINVLVQKDVPHWFFEMIFLLSALFSYDDLCMMPFTFRFISCFNSCIHVLLPCLLIHLKWCLCAVTHATSYEKQSFLFWRSYQLS